MSSSIPVNLEVLITPHFQLIFQQSQGNEEKYKLKNMIFEWFLSNLEKMKFYIECAHYNGGHFLIDDLQNTFNSKIQNINFSFKSYSKIDFNTISIENVNKNDYSIGMVQFVFYFYKLYNDEMANNLEEDLPCTFHTYLPSSNLNGLWESLLFDSDLQYNLLNYIRTSIMFGKRRINTTLVNWNKVLLLHGPPGTGKTSLCKALCQKLSIFLYDQFKSFQLIEINSHSLFSKWFSESGKLVLKLFDSIREFAQDSSSIIFVLIDEVESLVYDRQKANDSDPSDALRVVNALLTQLDSIKRYPNIIILANSNVNNALDSAFIDRVDIKQFIGFPSFPVIYQIYFSSIQEMIESQLIVISAKDTEILPYSKLSNYKTLNSLRLYNIAKLSENFTGRTLRKLPFLAFALYCNGMEPILLTKYLKFLEMAVHKQINDDKHFNNNNNNKTI